MNSSRLHGEKQLSNNLKTPIKVKKLPQIQTNEAASLFKSLLMVLLTIFLLSKKAIEKSQQIRKFLAVEIIVDDSVEFFPHGKSLADLSSVALIVLVSQAYD